MTEREPEPIGLLYQETAKVAAIFWEWRHKVMTMCFTGIGALFVVAGWLYQQGFSRLIAAALLFGSILSFVSLLLDLRTGEILRECYRVGESLELELRHNKAGIFNSIRKAHTGKGFTFTRGLQIAYFIVGGLLLVLSIIAVCYPIKK
jgi:hypothetical protein